MVDNVESMSCKGVQQILIDAERTDAYRQLYRGSYQAGQWQAT